MATTTNPPEANVGNAGAAARIGAAGPIVTQENGGFLIRVGAAIIDGILLGVVGSILNQIFGTGTGGGLSTLASLAYVLYFWTTTGQTIGHKVIGYKVVKEDSGPLDLTTAIIRYVGEVISIICLGLGFLWVIWDPQKQGWHDKLAKTYVVRA